MSRADVINVAASLLWMVTVYTIMAVQGAPSWASFGTSLTIYLVVLRPRR